MTRRQPEPYGEKHLQPAMPVGSEDTKELAERDRALSIQRMTLAMHEALDSDELSRRALDLLTDPDLFGYTVGLIFVKEAGCAELRGEAVGVSGPEGSELRALRQRFGEIRIPLELGAEYPLVKTLRAKRPVIIPAEEEPLFQDVFGALPVPPEHLILTRLTGRSEANGVLVLGCAEAGHDPADLARVELLARHLGLARGRLLVQAAYTDQQSGLAAFQDATETILSSTNLADVLLLTARVSTQLAGASRAMVWTYEESSRELTLAGQYVAEPSEVLDGAISRLQNLAQNCARQGGGISYPDVREAEEMNLASFPHPLPMVAIPLTAFGEILGVLAAVDRESSARSLRPTFAQSDEDMLRLIGSLAALTIKTVRLQESRRDVEKHLAENQRALVETERMASLGELSAKLVQDLRNPLSAIAGFARRIERSLPKDHASKEDASIVCREAQRLEEVLAQQIQVARPRPPRLAMRQITQILHQSVTLLREEMMSRGVFLEETYAPQVPDLLLDGDRVQQVVLNILRSCIDSVSDGDTIRIETLREGDRVLLEIANTGDQLPGEILSQLFVPFATSGPAGAGLGLAVAQQVIREHGGEISVRSEGEWGTIYTISLPIQANQERRRGADRRTGKDRRRSGRGRNAA